MVARHGQAWSSTGPATLRIHDGVELDKLELVSGAQHLGLDGKYDVASGAMAANLRAQKLDLKQLVGLVKPSMDLPDTRAGDRSARHAAPKSGRYAEVDARRIFGALAAARAQSHPLQSDAHYADDRAKAEWKLAAIDQ